MYVILFALIIICLVAFKVLKEGYPVKWQYNPKLSDWDNTLSLVNAMHYTPVIPMDSFIANILLHFEGACEDDLDVELTLKDYLEIGILDHEEGMLADFDYE